MFLILMTVTRVPRTLELLICDLDEISFFKSFISLFQRERGVLYAFIFYFNEFLCFHLPFRVES
jgi:hypothetical protein